MQQDKNDIWDYCEICLDRYEGLVCHCTKHKIINIDEVLKQVEKELGYDQVCCLPDKKTS